MIKHRNELPILMNELGLTGTGVEVGVYRGEFSQHLVRYSNLTRFFAVDCWTHIEGQVDPLNQPTAAKVDHMIQAAYRLAEFPHATILRAKSVDAAECFRDLSLDFVYIDADHRYEQVLEDIHTWSRKVAPNGILAGHDYHPDFPGVIKAVEHYWRRNREIYITEEKAPAEYPSWIVRI
jgi:hypothetical protein